MTPPPSYATVLLKTRPGPRPRVAGMEQRISLITLGVRTWKARAFYEGLGWHTNATPDDDVASSRPAG